MVIHAFGQCSHDGLDFDRCGFAVLFHEARNIECPRLTYVGAARFIQSATLVSIEKYAPKAAPVAVGFEIGDRRAQTHAHCADARTR